LALHFRPATIEQHMPNKSQSKLSLWFLNPNDPTLERVSFFYDPELGVINSSRGRNFLPSNPQHGFNWTLAVRAMSLLCISALSSENEPQGLSGSEGSPAASLDYSISKNTAWLADMFGIAQDGSPLARKLFLRSNPERKRPGPVVISLNTSIISAPDIELYLDNNRLTSKEQLDALYESIEMNFRLLRGSMPARKNRVVQKKPGEVTNPHIDRFIGGPQMIEPPNVKISHYLTPLEMEQSYLEGLRRRELSIDYSVVEPAGMESYKNRMEGNQYRYYRSSSNLAESIIPSLVKHLPKQFAYGAVYPGMGTKEEIIIKGLRGAGKSFRYSIIEFSQALAISAASRQETPVDIYIANPYQRNILKAVSEKMRGELKMPLFLSFVGNTIGNPNHGETLHSLAEALSEDDLVYLDVRAEQELPDLNEEERLDLLAEEYESDSIRSQFLSTVGICGITPEDGVIELETSRDRLIPEIWICEHFFRFTKDTSVFFGGENLSFFEGERLSLGVRHQYTRNVLEKILVTHGFSLLQVLEHPDGAIGVLLRLGPGSQKSN